MSNDFDFVMTEHAAWSGTDATRRRVFLLADGARWCASVQERNLTWLALDGGIITPQADVFVMQDDAFAQIPELRSALVSLGRVVRLRNENLWDAIAMAITRQVIRAGQSKKLYRAFCSAYGERVSLPCGESHALFPAPELVLRLSDNDFSVTGMAFKRHALRAAAKGFLEHGRKWLELPPSALIEELQTVPHIGAWTAGAATADWSNDWALYPYSDLAVRTWAGRAAVSYDWPSDEPAFGRLWRTLAGDHLSTLTLLTLAWGSQHGEIG